MRIEKKSAKVYQLKEKDDTGHFLVPFKKIKTPPCPVLCKVYCKQPPRLFLSTQIIIDFLWE